MVRYFLYLSYNGKKYHGWQIQPNGNSVQEELENKISVLLKENISVTGAGRTDAGVHAKLMVAHFDTTTALLNLTSFAEKLNGFLPRDISIIKIVPVKEEAHARFDAISRTYEYHISLKKNPFLDDYCFSYTGKLDFEKMNEAASLLFNYEDFTSFSKLHTDAKTNICKIMKAQWQKQEDIYVFTIQANRFLRNMVRAIVGTLMEVGRGKISTKDFTDIIENKNRSLAGVSMPAQGLFLVDIEYPKDIF